MKIALILAVAVLSACNMSTDLYTGTIEGKTPFPNPESLRVKWEAMEKCSGIKGDFDKMHFFTATRIVDSKGEHGGVWLKPTNDIVVVEDIRYYPNNREWEHEIMHALLNHGGHPSLFFNGVCGDLLHPWT